MSNRYSFEPSNSSPFKELAAPLKNLKYVPLAFLGLFVLSTVWTSFYSVPADSVGVLSRWGVLGPLVPPGLHFKLPLGIDDVKIVPVERQMKQEFGFETPGATYEYQSSDPDQQRLARNMVTGDLNSVQVAWVVQFRISDPKLYLFNVRNSDETLRDASESVMREIVGDRSVDEVITVGRSEIESVAKTKLQELSNVFELGVTIDQVQLNDVLAPEPVQSSFREVNQAQQEKEQAVNVANGEYNRVVPKAKGEAEQKISGAEGYALKRVNEAEGDAARFSQVFNEYKKSPDVTRRRMYLETMSKVLPKLSKPYVIDPSLPGVLPTLPLLPGFVAPAQLPPPQRAAVSR